MNIILGSKLSGFIFFRCPNNLDDLFFFCIYHVHILYYVLLIILRSLLVLLSPFLSLLILALTAISFVFSFSNTYHDLVHSFYHVLLCLLTILFVWHLIMEPCCFYCIHIFINSFRSRLVYFQSFSPFMFKYSIECVITQTLQNM